MRAVQRILAVFESFTAQRTLLTLQEIADCIDLPKSTAFRIVHSLVKSGHLVRLEDHHYCLSFRFTRLAGCVNSTLGIREIARPVMTSLAERSKETVSIHTVSGRDRVCIDAVAAAMPLRNVIQPGEHVPLLGGSASKSLIAHMPEKEMTPIVAAISRSTRRSPDQVLDELSKIRRQGYAVSHGERLLGVSAISVPITDVREEVHYCLSINGPSVRMHLQEQRLIVMAMAAAADISRQFGGRLQ
jgi:DNA-binding IclR family transcriptional regulator